MWTMQTARARAAPSAVTVTPSGVAWYPGVHASNASLLTRHAMLSKLLSMKRPTKLSSSTNYLTAWTCRAMVPPPSTAITTLLSALLKTTYSTHRSNTSRSNTIQFVITLTSAISVSYMSAALTTSWTFSQNRWVLQTSCVSADTWVCTTSPPILCEEYHAGGVAGMPPPITTITHDYLLILFTRNFSPFLLYTHYNLLIPRHEKEY
jgi:hypothetical protein